MRLSKSPSTEPTATTKENVLFDADESTSSTTTTTVDNVDLHLKN